MVQQRCWRGQRRPARCRQRAAYPKSDESSGGCLFASFRSPCTYTSSTRRRSCSRERRSGTRVGRRTCSQSATCVLSCVTVFMRSCRTVTACAGWRASCEAVSGRARRRQTAAYQQGRIVFALQVHGDEGRGAHGRRRRKTMMDNELRCRPPTRWQTGEADPIRASQVTIQRRCGPKQSKQPCAALGSTRCVWPWLQLGRELTSWLASGALRVKAGVERPAALAELLYRPV